MARLTAVSLAFSLVAVAYAQTNPLEGIPDLSSLGICPDECKEVFAAQESVNNGDLSSVCTQTFATGMGTCLECMAGSVLAAALTDEIKDQAVQAVASYEQSCASTGNSVTVPLGAFETGASKSDTVSQTKTDTSADSSETETQANDGAAFVNVPAIGFSAAFMAALAIL